MPAITPSFMFDLESNMRVITQNEYQRLTTQLWWTQIAKQTTTTSKKERLIWLLDTARIERTGQGGNLEFEDIVSTTAEITVENAAAGLKLKKEAFEDVDGNGIDLAAHWSRQIGSYSAYWPQRCVAEAIRANPITYDGKTFFAKDHPLNPYSPQAGTFANVFTGAAAAANPALNIPAYPGALPIDDSVTVDVALTNLTRAIGYATTMKLPNGKDPRFLKFAYLFVPPRMLPRAQQLTNAKFIAQAAAGGGVAVGDVEAIVSNLGVGQPVQLLELGEAFGGSDTDYYLGMEDLTTSELGAFVYVQREPFSVLFYGPQSDAQLARIREFQWMTEGRNSVQPGHPYLLFKGSKT
jgi:hypothetical protein